MCGIAISRFGYSVDLFYDLTPIEFKYAVLDISRSDVDKFKVQWEVDRYIVLHLTNISGKSLKHPLRNLKDIGLFPWEVDEILNRKQDLSEMESQLNRIEKAFKNVKKKDKKKERNKNNK